MPYDSVVVAHSPIWIPDHCFQDSRERMWLKYFINPQSPKIPYSPSDSYAKDRIHGDWRTWWPLSSEKKCSSFKTMSSERAFEGFPWGRGWWPSFDGELSGSGEKKIAVIRADVEASLVGALELGLWGILGVGDFLADWDWADLWLSVKTNKCPGDEKKKDMTTQWFTRIF